VAAEVIDVSDAPDGIHEKLRKLLALAKSTNVHEAAAAAAKAQELIAKYRIEAAMLDDTPDRARPGADESVVVRKIHAFETWRVDAWALSLVCDVARVNGCSPWYHGSYPGGPAAFVEAAGFESDLATSCFLCDYLVREVIALARAAQSLDRAERRGRTWMNNFRLGAATEIGRRLEEGEANAARRLLESAKDAPRTKDAPRKRPAWAEPLHGPRGALEADEPAREYALVQVEQALAKIEERRERVRDWVGANKRLSAGRSRASSFDEDAYEAGRRAGRRVALSPRNGRLGS
jgi:hypothetical protein